MVTVSQFYTFHSLILSKYQLCYFSTKVANIFHMGRNLLQILFDHLVMEVTLFYLFKYFLF
jgi:hypothetical protein